MGLDDMAALVMLAAGGAQLGLVTTVHGVCEAPSAAPLAQRLLAGLEIFAPVVHGADQPITTTAAELPSWVAKHRAKLEKVSELLELPEQTSGFREDQAASTASSALLETAETAANEGLTLLALGPLTNVAAAAQSDLSKFQKVIGTIILAGDCTKANPFNFRLDPAALDLVLNSGVGSLGLSHSADLQNAFGHFSSETLKFTESELSFEAKFQTFEAKVPIHMVGTRCRPNAKQLEELLEKPLTNSMLVKILEQHPLSLARTSKKLRI